MNVSQIRYFVEIAKHQSLSKAAEALFVSPSALSISISKLESELDAQLFERNKSGMFLTEQGKLILEDAQEIISMLQSWNYKLHAHGTKISGTIKLLSCPAVTQSLLLGFVQKMKDLYPELDIIIDDQFFTFDHFLQSKASLAFVMFSEGDASFRDVFNKMADYGYSYELLYQESLCIYLNKNNPLASATSITIEDLKKETFVTLHNNELDTTLRHYLTFFPKSQIISLPNRNAILAFLRNNTNAFALLSSSSIEQDPLYHDPSVTTRSFENGSLTQDIILFHPDERTISPIEKIVVAAIKESI